MHPFGHLPISEFTNPFILLCLPVLCSPAAPLPCPANSKLSHQASHRSSCFLVIHFRHSASWLDLPTASENKSLPHFSCVTGLTNKLLSQFYTDACKWPGSFHTECFLQAGIVKKMKYIYWQQYGPLSGQRIFLAARFSLITLAAVRHGSWFLLSFWGELGLAHVSKACGFEI